MIESLYLLSKDSKPGDELACYHSGHGSYVNDSNGDENDKTDEFIVTHDLNFDKRETYLLDDEIAAWLATIPEGVNITIIIDTCFSGSMTRNIKTARFAVPPSHLAVPSGKKSKNKRVGANSPKVLYFGACQDDEESLELSLGGKQRGAFTFTLTKKLRNNPKQIWKEVYKEVGDEMKPFKTQHPNMAGDKFLNRAPFGI
jgi:hypothetical protein